MAFQKAEKTKAKLRIALGGVSGSGKTYSALVLAKALGGRWAVIDSERASALLYADLFDFDHQDLTNHAMSQYKQALKDAAAAGYDGVIIDSLSHEWAGRGGALEAVDRKMANPNTNKFTAWNGVSQEHQGLLDDILAYPGHIIATLRKKTEYVLETNDKGKQVPRKVGLAPVQREGIEYEFTAMLGLELGGAVIVEKTRCPVLTDMGEALRRDDIDKAGIALRDWLASGKDAPPREDPMVKEKAVLLALFETSPEGDFNSKLWPRVEAFRKTADFKQLEAAFIAGRRAAKERATPKAPPTPPALYPGEPMDERIARGLLESAKQPTQPAPQPAGDVPF